MFTNLRQGSKKEACVCRTIESMILTRIQESIGDSSFLHQSKAKLIKIDERDSTYSVVFLADGKHVVPVSDGEERKIRRWGVENDTDANGFRAKRSA